MELSAVGYFILPQMGTEGSAGRRKIYEALFNVCGALRADPLWGVI